jgi:hypothetical protein
MTSKKNNPWSGGIDKGPVERLDYPDSGKQFTRWGQQFKEIADAGAPNTAGASNSPSAEVLDGLGVQEVATTEES